MEKQTERGLAIEALISDPLNNIFSATIVMLKIIVQEIRAFNVGDLLKIGGISHVHERS